MREAHRRAEAVAARRRGDVPPRGWDVPREASAPVPRPKPRSPGCSSSARGACRRRCAQLAEALRELLLALRALIDFYLERLEPGRAPARTVEDIPIE